MLINETLNGNRFLWALLPCAVILCLAAWLRGAEYDEQYTLFLTSGVPRPVWPSTVFFAGLARDTQAGQAGLGAIAHDLRTTDVHPPLYFWLVSLWRGTFGHGLFVARLLSVCAGLGALALTGVIARSARLPAVPAMLLTCCCYAFTYTCVIARGFALAQVLLLGGVACLLLGGRSWHFALAGVLFGAATLTNYLSVFTVSAALLAIGLELVWPRPDSPGSTTTAGKAGRGNGLAIRRASAATLGFLAFIPADLWWFLAQRGGREGQFPPFSLVQSLARLAARAAGAIIGGLPLYFDRPASTILTVLLSLLLLWVVACVGGRWRRIGTFPTRVMFALAAVAPPLGLLGLGAIFNNMPIEVRYLTFSTPFLALLLGGALGARCTAVLLALQAAALAGLMMAPQTMQPARASARAAAALVGDGIVLLPRGNDGVGIVGAFAIESPATLPLLLIDADDTPDRIRARIGTYRRVVLALLEQDTSSLAASEAMRRALTTQDWREVARGSNVAVYERTVSRE